MNIGENKRIIMNGIFVIFVLLAISFSVTASTHDANIKTKPPGKNSLNDQHRHTLRSTPKLSSTTTSISSPNYLYLPKSTSGTLPVTSSDIFSQYSLPNGSYFTHMAFDRRNSVLYAGASNRILQLNYNLSLLSQATTGPKPDNPQCRVCTEDSETLETTNHNKILVVNEASSTLITCGSVMQVRINSKVAENKNDKKFPH